MSKVYVTLRDKNTSFHDQQQRASITGSRIGRVHMTGKVSAMINAGALRKHSKEDAEGKFIEQQKALLEQELKKPENLQNPLYIKELKDSISDIVPASAIPGKKAKKDAAAKDKKGAELEEQEQQDEDEDDDEDEGEGEGGDEDEGEGEGGESEDENEDEEDKPARPPRKKRNA